MSIKYNRSIHIGFSYFENTTTSTTLVAEGSEKSDVVHFVKFVDGETPGILVEVPRRSGAVGHHVSFSFSASDGDKEIVIAATAKVDQQEKGNDRDTMVLYLVQFDMTEWKGLRIFFDERQKSVLDLFNQLKGN